MRSLARRAVRVGVVLGFLWALSGVVTAIVCISRDGWKSPVPSWWINFYLTPFLLVGITSVLGMCGWGVVTAWKWAGRWSEGKR